MKNVPNVNFLQNLTVEETGILNINVSCALSGPNTVPCRLHVTLQMNRMAQHDRFIDKEMQADTAQENARASCMKI
jgi:hypothetical protein